MRYIKIILLVLLVCSLYGFIPQSRIEAEVEISQQPTINQINYFAKIYGVESRIVAKVIDCESNGKQSAVGDSGRSRGIAQFQKPTWNWMEKKFVGEYGDKLDYNSSFDQIKLLSYAISKGWGNNWTSYVAIKKGGKFSFYSKQLNRHFTVKCNL